jgi:hypothetical protein
MFKNVSKPKVYEYAAWYSFLGPLAAVGLFLSAGRAELELPSALLSSFLLSAFSSALGVALATLFAPRILVPRPVKEIACLGATVSALLLFMTIVMVTCSH